MSSANNSLFWYLQQQHGGGGGGGGHSLTLVYTCSDLYKGNLVSIEVSESVYVRVPMRRPVMK